MNSVQTPKVSIALTTYNGARFLRQQLDSIYHQTYKPLEVIAVDDVSSDETLKILDEYHRTHGLVIVLNTERLGFVINFAKVLSLCSGDFIALADQDDVWLPQKIETLVASIGNSSLICTDVSLIDENGVVFVESLQRKLHIPIPSEKNQFFTLAFLDYVRGCTCLFRRELLSRALPIPETAMSHDWWLGMWATRMHGIRYLPEPLTFYRQQSMNTRGVRRLWKVDALIRYLFSAKRKEIFRKERERIRLYLDTPLHRNNEEKEFLEDLYQHYSLMIHYGVHLKAFWLVFKHRRKILEDIGILPMYSYLCGRLI
jgi:glycosyltransferase involved in cell wall biosynthesis